MSDEVFELGDHIHTVCIPDGIEPAAWVGQRAATAPTTYPRGWPESARMCPVVVYRQHPDFSQDSETRAFLVTRPSAMRRLAASVKAPQLWYELPRNLFTPARCPALRPEDWQPEAHDDQKDA